MKKRNLILKLASLVLLAISTLSSICKATEIPIVAASSDLHNVLPKLASRFNMETGLMIHFRFASSDALVWQIYHGIPYQLFMADDKHSIIRIMHFGKAKNNPKIYAIGHLVLFAPLNSILSNPISFSELTYLIQKNKLTRFAIPNTEHCSYGRAAREVLMKMKVWVKMQPEVVPALNTYRAAQTSLNADGGIIPYSLAISPEFKNHGQFIIIPQDLYHPIQQEMILLKNANKTAIRFYNWLQSPEARFIFRQNGYDVPQN